MAHFTAVTPVWPGGYLRRPLRLQGLLTGLILVLAAGVPAFAQQATITPNYKDADIRQIIEAVGEVTGKNFVIDPRVKAQVTMLSTTPMTADAFYETFLSILQVHGFVAIPGDNLIKIVPDANARQLPAVSPDGAADEVVTRVIEVKNVAAAQLVPILRPLVPQYGHLAAHPASNMLIISDRAANVTRLMRIIARIDKASDEAIEVIPLQHASAGEIVRILTTLTQGTARQEGGPAARGANLVADDRTNSVLIGGEKASRLRMRALIAHLDTPLEEGGNTQVRYLRYADAEELATKLNEQVAQAAQQQVAQAGAPAGPRERGVIIWADAQTNALVITAPPKTMRELNAVIDKLDIRRAQVAVEAIIVEVTADKAADLGIQWILDGTDDNNVAAIQQFPTTGAAGIAQLAGTTIGDDPGTLLGLIPDGVTLAVGRVKDTGTNFVAILRALEGDGNTNILSTPSIVTMDNEEAEIKVGQEVPFLTGSFTDTGAAGTAVTPFQTIQRQEVGITLKVTPQINEGDAIMLNIEQESSSINQAATGAVDIITNKRTITTSVLVDDGGIVVLGGLIEDTLLEAEQRVPGLGRIPLLGNLFKTRSTSKVKTNLMVFIRPKILRDGVQATVETNSKYNYMRDLQLVRDPDDVQLMPRETRPVLPPFEELVPEASRGESSGASAGEQSEEDGS